MEKSGLFIYEPETNTSSARDKFINRLMFPIFSAYGEITGFGGRTLGDSPAKYINSPETLVFDKSRNLYAINFARKSKSPVFIICEGYMDVCALHQAGFNYAVAALGTAFNKNHANELKRYTKKCVLVFDSDEAGTKASLRAIPVLEEAGITVSVLSLKGAKDPDEFIKTYGAAAFADALSTAVSSVTYRILDIKSRHDLATPEGKTAFGTQAAALLSELPNIIERNAYAVDVAKIADIPADAVIAEINKKAANDNIITPAINRNRDNTGALQAEKQLIATARGSIPVCMAIKEILPPDFLSDNIYRQLLHIIYENAEAGKSLLENELVSIFEDAGDQSKAANVLNIEPLDIFTDPSGGLTELVRRILRDYYTAVIDRLGKTNDSQALNDALFKKNSIGNIKIVSGGVLL